MSKRKRGIYGRRGSQKCLAKEGGYSSEGSFLLTAGCPALTQRVEMEPGRKGEHEKGKQDGEHQLSLLQNTANAGCPTPSPHTACGCSYPANGGPDHNCHSSKDKSAGDLLHVPCCLGPGCLHCPNSWRQAVWPPLFGVSRVGVGWGEQTLKT